MDGIKIMIKILIVSFMSFFIFCTENKKDIAKVESSFKIDEMLSQSGSLYEKVNLKCDKVDLPNSCNYQDFKIKFNYNDHLNFLTISNRVEEKKFSIEENFSGTGLRCSLFESKSKKYKLVIVELEYEYSLESYFYLISSKEIKFRGKFLSEIQSDDFQGLEYKVSDNLTSARIQIKNGRSIKTYTVNYAEISRNNSVSNVKADTHLSDQESKSIIDLKNIKGEYYLDIEKDEVQLLLEFEKDFVFLIESGNMGRLYNKHLLKTIIEAQKMKLYYIETKNGSPKHLRANLKIGELFIENNTLFIDSDFLKNEYDLNNKVRVVKSK
ncbi:hypothetical protein [Flavobacterium sp. H122]|uniref:hypothetical protein n=1 Tax=Flavobacterium sp. H122 TaxID=2529860 RepID=UPI0010AA5A98|nr:hypothetical protein [Flavobacterium sp. H122]